MFVSWELWYYLTGFDFKICLGPEKLPGLFKKQVPGQTVTKLEQK